MKASERAARGSILVGEARVGNGCSAARRGRCYSLMSCTCLTSVSKERLL